MKGSACRKIKKGKATGIITQQRIYSLRSNHIWFELLRTDYDNFDLWSNSYTSELRAGHGITWRCLYHGHVGPSPEAVCSFKKQLPLVDCKVQLDKESPYVFKN